MTTPGYRSRRLITISAMGRSGASMFARLLDGHPALLAYPFDPGFNTPKSLRDFESRRDDFLLRLPARGSLRDLMESAGHHRLFQAIVQRSKRAKGAFLDVDRASYEAMLDRQHEVADYPSYLALVSEAFFSALPAAQGAFASATHIAWHSTSGIFWLRQFNQVVPADNILVVRHPLDMLSSLLRAKMHVTRISPRLELAAWCYCLVEAFALRRAGRAIQIVRYEDLCSAPETSMADVAGNLGLPYDDILSRPTLFGEPWLGNGSYGQYQGISPASTGVFHKRLPLEARAWFAPLAPYAEAMGYYLDEPYVRSPQWKVAEAAIQEEICPRLFELASVPERDLAAVGI